MQGFVGHCMGRLHGQGSSLLLQMSLQVWLSWVYGACKASRSLQEPQAMNLKPNLTPACTADAFVLVSCFSACIASLLLPLLCCMGVYCIGILCMHY